MRSTWFFILLLTLTSVAFSYLIWWTYLGEYSGDYAHLYGFTFTDKLAFTFTITLIIIILISIVKLWRSPKYFVFLMGGFIISFIWSDNFYLGHERLRLTGCFESQCSSISIRSNGTFSMTYSNQNSSKSYRGNYLVKGDNIHLYSSPKFLAVEQEVSLNDLKKNNCVQVIAEDFELWSGCFVLP